MVEEISPKMLASKMSSNTAPRLIDVREPWEYVLCSIEGSENIPMNNIPMALEQFDKSASYIAICHHGMRSLQVANYLVAQGIQTANLTGGIDLWAQSVEPNMARY